MVLNSKAQFRIGLNCGAVPPGAPFLPSPLPISLLPGARSVQPSIREDRDRVCGPEVIPIGFVRGLAVCCINTPTTHHLRVTNNASYIRYHADGHDSGVSVRYGSNRMNDARSSIYFEAA